MFISKVSPYYDTMDIDDVLIKILDRLDAIFYEIQDMKKRYG